LDYLFQSRMNTLLSTDYVSRCALSKASLNLQQNCLKITQQKEQRKSKHFQLRGGAATIIPIAWH